MFYDTVAKCTWQNGDFDHLTCVVSAKGLFSYVQKYKIIITSTSGDNFIGEPETHSLLRNVVNLNPIGVDMNGPYVIFNVQNKLPLKKGEATLDTISIIKVDLCKNR